MRWIMSGLAILAGVLGLTTVAVAGNSGLSPIVMSPTVTDAAASVPVAAAAAPVSKYDAVFSVCGYSHSADQSPYNIETDNLISPAGAIDSYFSSRGLLPNFISGRGVPEPILVKILKNPEHGKLVARNATEITFTYHAKPGYLGPDQMVFEVETMGKKFKVIQTEVIQNSGNLDYPTDAATEAFDKACPSDKGSALDIIELPTDGFAAVEELANLRIIGDRPRLCAAARRHPGL